MSYLYKLGDGPINYDWNHRYAWLDGSELFYSPSLSDSEKKTLNIYGAAVTNICKIKNKDYAFGIILNPPTNKIIYFAFDDLEDAQNFRDKVISATLNINYDDTIVMNEFADCGTGIKKNEGKINSFNNKCSLTNFDKNKNNNEKLFNIGFNIKRKKNSNEFYQSLEMLRKDYIVEDTKTIKKFGRGLKISVPVELEYANFYQNCLIKTLSTLMIFFTMFFSVNFIESYFFKSTIITLIILLIYYKKKFFFISFLKKKLSNKKLKKCDYIAKATTIVDCDANKIYNILSDLKLRREWDNFIRKPEHINSKCNTCSCGDEFKARFSIPENYFISSIANPLIYDIEVIKHIDDNENCYIIYKNKSEKSDFFESEFLEIFLLIPLKDYEETKTLVIFITNIDFFNDKNHLDFDFSEILSFNFKNIILPNISIIPYFTAQKLKEERLMIVANLKEFIVNFNTFEVDSIIDQIPHIKNLSISRSNTKTENDMKKIENSNNSIPNFYHSNNSNGNNNANGNISIINGISPNNNIQYNDNNNNFNYHNPSLNLNQENDYSCNISNSNYINNTKKTRVDHSEYVSNSNHNLASKDLININNSLYNPGLENLINKNSNIQNLNTPRYSMMNSQNNYLTNKQAPTFLFDNNEINESFYDACSEAGDNIIISNRCGEIFFKKSILQINPNSILTNGNPIPLGERLKNYIRNPEGGVECRNNEELHSQDGIILELMKRAGKQLMEGKNIVGVSLPVKIFEPRSTLTRLTDIWGCAYEYFNKAADSINPVERMKMIITMAMSGLHMNAKQTKPFNPILGETYEAYWPDNSKIYMEHMSHHPPISRFLIFSGSKRWKFYGYYEYAVKIKSLTGNVIGGQFKGPNVLEIFNKKTGRFDIIEYTLPTMNISGMLYGKRIIEWEGVSEFKDENNGIYAYLKFTPAPKFYQKFVEPTDVFRGEITQKDEVIHNIYGSPIDKILFDDQVYWELEKSDIIRPIEPKTCLPSDCRYREDMVALAEGNIELADKEKVRLEVIQRADRVLRQKMGKIKGHN